MSYPFDSPSDCSETAPRSDAARVVGDIARCWANYFGCYGIEPTHVFLGEKEWNEFDAWTNDQLSIPTESTAKEYFFKGMKVYKTDRPGITCAVCFHEPQLDADPPARKPSTGPAAQMMKDPSSQDT